MTTSVQQRRALRLLADAPHGRTVADMLAHGFTNALLDRLARDGLARSSRERYAPARGGLPLSGWRSPKPVSERLPTSGRSGDTASDRTPFWRMLAKSIGSPYLLASGSRNFDNVVTPLIGHHDVPNKLSAPL